MIAIVAISLALIAWAVAVPSSAIVAFALGLKSRGGQLIIAGFMLAGLGLALILYAVWPTALRVDVMNRG